MQKYINVDQFKLEMLDRMMQEYLSATSYEDATDNIMDMLRTVIDVSEFAQGEGADVP